MPKLGGLSYAKQVATCWIKAMLVSLSWRHLLAAQAKSFKVITFLSAEVCQAYVDLVTK